MLQGRSARVVFFVTRTRTAAVTARKRACDPCSSRMRALIFCLKRATRWKGDEVSATQSKVQDRGRPAAEGDRDYEGRHHPGHHDRTQREEKYGAVFNTVHPDRHPCERSPSFPLRRHTARRTTATPLLRARQNPAPASTVASHKASFSPAFQRSA